MKSESEVYEYIFKHLQYDDGVFYWGKRPYKSSLKIGSVAGYLDREGRWKIKIKRKYMRSWLVYLYFFKEFPPKGMDLDHINRDKLDDRIENLRVLTRSQNLINKTAQKNNKTSGIKNLHFYRNKWEVKWQIDRKRLSKRFLDKDEAVNFIKKHVRPLQMEYINQTLTA